MTTMLERAARALCAEELLLSVHEVNEIWNDLPETKRAAVLNRARAVLMAVREPDDAFMLAIYPDPNVATADRGRAAGRRSRDAGRRQIAHFVDAIASLLEDTGSPAHMRVAKELRGE